MEKNKKRNGVQSFENVTANCPEFYNIISVLREGIFNLCNQPYPRIKLGKRKNTIFEEYECNVLEGSY